MQSMRKFHVNINFLMGIQGSVACFISTECHRMSLEHVTHQIIVKVDIRPTSKLLKTNDDDSCRIKENTRIHC